MEHAVEEILNYVGEDLNREGLEKTPQRVRESWEFLTQGYHQDLNAVINGAIYEAPDDNMIIVKDIEIYSLCEHHMLPFFGKCQVGYIPDKKVIGVSKIARIADIFSRRLQIQERMTRQIADALMEAIQPKGVGVIVEAKHLCMMMRGVEKQNSEMRTSAMLGAFRKRGETRAEFMSLVTR